MSADLLKLRREWAKRLKDSGFHDIESFAETIEKADSYRLNASKGARSAKQDEDAANGESYYRAAGIFLHQYQFACETDRTVFALWAEGASYRDIGRRVGMAASTVHKVLHRLRLALDAAITDRTMFADD